MAASRKLQQPDHQRPGHQHPAHRTIIERLDAAIDQEVEVISMSHADAGEVVQLINRIYPANDGAQSAVADERTNTVVLSGDPARRLRLRTLISHLDTPLESEGSTR
jgi:general secretion pathway protein D